MLLTLAAALCVSATAAAKKPPTKPPANGAATVTLAASSLKVVYGGATTLSGKVSTQAAGETITILAQPYGSSAYTSLGNVTTTTGGVWTYTTKPTIGTSYEARVKNATSPAASVGVAPLVALHVLTGRRFSTKVVAAHAFAGKVVQLQRRSSLGQWVTLARATLNSTSSAVFHPTLPVGASTLRVAFSVNQAGAGYLAGISRTISYRR